MYIVHVFIHVKAEKLNEFESATLENALKSRHEPGVARFDVIQQIDDPTRFVLVEIYRSQEDAAKHKETAHYNRWREVAEPMMAEPRSRNIYKSVSPDDAGWD
jgi:(4S)-4-hydroxy-5-phosphonooxypentane-2,3-dione isomerase